MIAFADVGVSVSDAKASASWWKEKLGFSVFTLGGEGGHAVLVAPPGDRYILHLCEGFERVEPGNTGIAFVATDVMRMAEEMAAKGVEFAEPAKKTEWGASAKFKDPDGNVFWLVEGPASLIRQTMTKRAPKGASAKGRAAPKKTKAPGKKGAKKRARPAAKKTAKRRAR